MVKPFSKSKKKIIETAEKKLNTQLSPAGEIAFEETLKDVRKLSDNEPPKKPKLK